MNRALRIVSTSYGVFAGVGSVEHGIFELMQGRIKPDNFMIASMGPPCQPELVWNACEPAMTILPTFFLTGIMAISVGLVGIVWSLLGIERRYGGLILVLVCVAMLLFGGGIFPPVIGIVGGLVATRIGRPLIWWNRHASATGTRMLAGLWPWVLVLFFVVLLGQWVVGGVANALMQQIMVANLILILALLMLSVLAAFAADVLRW